MSGIPYFMVELDGRQVTETGDKVTILSQGMFKTKGRDVLKSTAKYPN